MSINKLPTLFKKSSSGAILQWDIGVEETSTIVTVHGQVGGKMQTTKDLIRKGKNLRRAGETDRGEQALKEATAKWMKQKKAGYVESIGAAKAGATDAVIEGGVLPMLAKVYEEHLSKVKYPVAVQPKVDGIRCICLVNKDGGVTLWTRTRKRITSVPQIVYRMEYIAKKSGLKNVVLDGQIYSDLLKEDFEKLISAVRKIEPTPESAQLQYWVYDIVSPKCFRDRISTLNDIILLGSNEVQLLETKFANSEEEAKMYFKLFKSLGYEGSMVRLLGRGYEHKRSDQLLKVKTFSDQEYKIVGMEEGRGKLQGHCGAFVCVTEDGKEFRVKMSGETSKLKEYWDTPKESVGQMLTVKFQGLTNDGIPRFPVGLRIREDI